MENVALTEPICHSNLVEENVNLEIISCVDVKQHQHNLDEVAGSSTENKDRDDVSSTLNSEQEQIIDELSDFVEDSDCSVKDKDYVPESENSEDESVEGKFAKYFIQSDSKVSCVIL